MVRDVREWHSKSIERDCLIAEKIKLVLCLAFTLFNGVSTIVKDGGFLHSIDYNKIWSH